MKLEFVKKPIEIKWEVWYESEISIDGRKYRVQYLDSDETEDLNLYDENGKQISSGPEYDEVFGIFKSNSIVFKEADPGDTFLDGENEKWDC